MSPKELREKSVVELKKVLTTLLKEKFNLNMQSGLNKTAKPHLIKNVRRTIARVNTILNEKAGQQ